MNQLPIRFTLCALLLSTPACSRSAGSPPAPVDPAVASDAFLGNGNRCLEQARYACALENYSQAVKLNPQSGHALTNLAWVLATAPDKQYRNGARAITLADSAVHIATRNGNLPDNLGYSVALAAAYAEVGSFAEAVNIMNGVLAIARQGHHDQQYIDMYQKYLDSFLAGKPWRYSPE